MEPPSLPKGPLGRSGVAPQARGTRGGDGAGWPAEAAEARSRQPVTGSLNRRYGCLIKNTRRNEGPKEDYRDDSVLENVQL